MLVCTKWLIRGWVFFLRLKGTPTHSSCFYDKNSNKKQISDLEDETGQRTGGGARKKVEKF